jgi:hypothetical protein
LLSIVGWKTLNALDIALGSVGQWWSWSTKDENKEDTRQTLMVVSELSWGFDCEKTEAQFMNLSV